jgi:hypothetical protein
MDPHQGASDTLLTIRLDRLLAISAARSSQKLPTIAGFKVVSDYRVRPQGDIVTYTRVRELKNPLSGTRVFWQYQPRAPWLKAWRIEWIAGEGREIYPIDVIRILKPCRYFQFIVVELAFDFSSASGVDHRFVRQHAKFGKSQRRFDRGGPEQLRYGARKSGKLVRCYWKEEVNAYRVELEFHSRLLTQCRHPNAEENYQFIDVPGELLPHDLEKHFLFVRIDWLSLARYIERRFGQQSDTILHRARRKARVSLSAVSRFLRKTGVNNVHRFLTPMKINKSIDEALTTWSLHFRDQWDRIQ